MNLNNQLNFNSIKNKENEKIEQQKIEAVEEVESVVEPNVDENEVEEIRTYKRVDCIEGYLTNNNEIEYFRVTQKQDVLFNYMFGEYDENGNYIIDENILTALVAVHKHNTQAFGDVIFLQSYKNFEHRGPIQFALSFSRAEGGQQKAILKVLEQNSKMGGYLINTHSFVIATYTDVNDEDYMQKVYKAFNIFFDDEEGGKEDPETVSAIINRIKLQHTAQGLYIKNLGQNAEKFYLSRLEVLRGTKYEKIMQEFLALKEKAEMFFDVSSPMYFMYLNQLLDMALENIKYKDAELYNQACQELESVTKAYIAEENVRLNVAVQEAEKELNVAPKVAGKKNDYYKEAGSGYTYRNKFQSLKDKSRTGDNNGYNPPGETTGKGDNQKDSGRKEQKDNNNNNKKGKEDTKVLEDFGGGKQGRSD